jgi:hypothetical protein
MDAQAAIYADSLEFYHDKGGLMTSKQASGRYERNICGKVTRELVKGSISISHQRLWRSRNRIA